MKNKTPILGACCSALLGLVALLMPLAPFIGVTLTVLGQSETEYVNGFDCIFGDGSNGGSTTAWILVLVGLVGIIGGIVAYLLKKERVGALILLIAGAVLLVGSVMYFFFVQFAGASNTDIGGIVGASYTLAIGAWIGGIVGILGGAIAALFGVRGILAK